MIAIKTHVSSRIDELVIWLHWPANIWRVLFILVWLCSSYNVWNSPLAAAFGQLHAHSIDEWQCGPEWNPGTLRITLSTSPSWRCQHCTSKCPHT